MFSFEMSRDDVLTIAREIARKAVFQALLYAAARALDEEKAADDCGHYHSLETGEAAWADCVKASLTRQIWLGVCYGRGGPSAREQIAARVAGDGIARMKAEALAEADRLAEEIVGRMERQAPESPRGREFI